jgi:hypothetical protein
MAAFPESFLRSCSGWRLRPARRTRSRWSPADIRTTDASTRSRAWRSGARCQGADPAEARRSEAATRRRFRQEDLPLREHARLFAYLHALEDAAVAIPRTVVGGYRRIRSLLQEAGPLLIMLKTGGEWTYATATPGGKRITAPASSLKMLRAHEWRVLPMIGCSASQGPAPPPKRSTPASLPGLGPSSAAPFRLGGSLLSPPFRHGSLDKAPHLRGTPA